MHFLSDSTGLYFYSAVFQGNMALLALIGVFIVFKLQKIANDLDRLNSRIIEFVAIYVDLTSLFGKTTSLPMDQEVETLPLILERLIKDKNQSILVRNQINDIKRSNKYLQFYEKRKFLNGIKSKIRQRMKIPFLWTLAVIVISLIFISLSHSLHNYNKILELVCMGCTILINIYALNLNAEFIWLTLQE
jgi:hypothetical protein